MHPREALDYYPVADLGERLEIDGINRGEVERRLKGEVTDLWYIPLWIFLTNAAGVEHRVVVNAVTEEVEHGLERCLSCKGYFIPTTLANCVYCGTTLCENCARSHLRCFICGGLICLNCWRKRENVARCTLCGQTLCRKCGILKGLIFKKRYCPLHA